MALSYLDKTYVIFDGKQDMAAYHFMRGWKETNHVDFDFHDAHDLYTEELSMRHAVRRWLRKRFASGRQVIVLVGEYTRHKHRFVRWQMDAALDLGLPIIAANLNQKRRLDPDRCPPVLMGECVVHVAFRARIIKYALDNFPEQFASRTSDLGKDFYYDDSVYRSLGLDD